MTALTNCCEKSGVRKRESDDQQFKQYRPFVLIIQEFEINIIYDRVQKNFFGIWSHTLVSRQSASSWDFWYFFVLFPLTECAQKNPHCLAFFPKRRGFAFYLKIYSFRKIFSMAFPLANSSINLSR